MSTKNILLEYCQRAVATLRQQCDAAALVGHRASMGEVRETILKDFLRDHLPESVNVASGVIFDHLGATSRQQDVVIVMKNMPKLPFSERTQLIFKEGVLAVVEVKSQLGGQALRTTCTGIESVHLLKHADGFTAQTGVLLAWPASKILTAIVAYDGDSFPALRRSMSGTPIQNLPDVVLNLSRGMLIKNNGELMPRNGSAPSGDAVTATAQTASGWAA